MDSQLSFYEKFLKNMVKKQLILHAKNFLVWKRKTKWRFSFPAYLRNVNENVNEKYRFSRNENVKGNANIVSFAALDATTYLILKENAAFP